MIPIALTIQDLDNELLRQNAALANYADYQARRTRAYQAALAAYQETLAGNDDIFVRANTFAAPLAIGSMVVSTTTGDIYTVALPTGARRIAGDGIMISKAASADFVMVPRMAWDTIVANGTSQTPYAFWEDKGQIVIYDKDGANFDATSIVNFDYYRQLDGTTTIGANLTPWPSGNYIWTNVTGTTQTMAPGNAYIANDASLVTFTPPVNYAIGDRFLIAGQGAGGWKLAQNALQQTDFLAGNTTNGITGFSESNRATDVIELVAIGTKTLQVVSTSGFVTSDTGIYVQPGPLAPAMDIHQQDFSTIVTNVLALLPQQ